MVRQDFPRRERIKRRAEIGKVFESGRKHSCRGMRLLTCANGLAANRFAVVPVKSFGSAVARNRVKRLVRECWRRIKPRFETVGMDCVIVVYPGFDSLEERALQLEVVLLQAGILRRSL